MQGKPAKPVASDLCKPKRLGSALSFGKDTTKKIVFSVLLEPQGDGSPPNHPQHPQRFELTYLFATFN